MSAYTYTHAYTRAQAVIDQVSVLFGEVGINETSTAKVCRGVENKWLEAVGLFLERNDRRVYEMEAKISWSTQSDLAELEFSTDLPGWENNGSPEVIILGSRFAAIAEKEGLNSRYWVRFTAAIRSNPQEHRRLCPEVGVVFGGSVPDWADTPRAHSMPLQDLREISLSVRSTLYEQ